MPKAPGSRRLLSPRARAGVHDPYASRGRARGSASKDGEDSAVYEPIASPGRGFMVDDSSSEDEEEAAVRKERKEWEEATCPICMEHPHNAVLLICSSHEKGCRPYMCDTSYRHSNCLDQYTKAHDHFKKNGSGATGGGALSFGGHERSDRALARFSSSRAVRGSPGAGAEQMIETGVAVVESERDGVAGMASLELLRGALAGDKGDVADLLCPLCRGKIVGWKVVESARQHLNCKIRSCSQEECPFTGPYDELRKHARGVHPSARPSDIDPVRQRDWRRLERQRDLGDVLSTIRLAMPGATVLGDRSIDDDEEHHDEGDDSGPPEWAVFLLFQVPWPGASLAGATRIPSRGRGRYYQIAHSSFARHDLWGENMPGSSGSTEQINMSEGSANVERSLGSTSRRRRSRQRGRGDVL